MSRPRGPERHRAIPRAQRRWRRCETSGVAAGCPGWECHRGAAEPPSEGCPGRGRLPGARTLPAPPSPAVETPVPAALSKFCPLLPGPAGKPGRGGPGAAEVLGAASPAQPSPLLSPSEEARCQGAALGNPLLSHSGFPARRGTRSQRPGAQGGDRAGPSSESSPGSGRRRVGPDCGRSPDPSRGVPEAAARGCRSPRSGAPRRRRPCPAGPRRPPPEPQGRAAPSPARPELAASASGYPAGLRDALGLSKYLRAGAARKVERKRTRLLPAGGTSSFASRLFKARPRLLSDLDEFRQLGMPQTRRWVAGAREVFIFRAGRRGAGGVVSHLPSITRLCSWGKVTRSRASSAFKNKTFLQFAAACLKNFPSRRKQLQKK